MLHHYFKSAFRHFLRNKRHAIINVSGLAIGIASTILISLYVMDEWSFDRFHENADRIFRLTLENEELSQQSHQPYVNLSTGQQIKETIAGVEDVVQLGITAPILLGFDGQYIVPEGSETYFSQKNFFDLFSFPFVAGDPSTALETPYSIIITKSLANKLFSEKDPMNQSLAFQVHGQERQELTVTGVLNDIPNNSHIQFECLVSFKTLEDINRNNPNWAEQTFSTYLLIKNQQQKEELENQINELEYAMASHKSQQSALHLQALNDIHLNSSHLEGDRAIKGDKQLVFILAMIALGILLIASFNFINLTTARSTDRMKEIGVRKSFGASRSILIKQFLGESMLICFIALITALLITETFLPFYNNFVGKNLLIAYGEVWPILIGFGLMLGLLSGGYPAIYLSKLKPVKIFKGQTIAGSTKSHSRRLFVIAQFAIATTLILATTVVWKQMDFIRQKDLGFQKDQVIYTVIPSNRPTGNQQFKRELLEHTQILEVGRAVVRPLYDVNTNFPLSPTLAEVGGEMIQPNIALRKIEIGYDFIETFDMRLLAGRTFDENIASDASQAFIINETALKAIGYQSANQALNRPIKYDGKEGTIIGILEDFHFEGMHQEIMPFVMVYNRFSPMVFIKIKPTQQAATIAHLQKTWEKHSTSKEAFNYNFMDEFYENQYEAENKLGMVLSAFGVLAIFLTFLGMLGLTTFSIEKRRKELGIRKVLGASVNSLIRLLSKETLVLLFIGNLIAWPLAWNFMNRWLQNFAYHSSLGVQHFFLVFLIIALITLSIVVYITSRAASRNPMEALQSD